MEISTHNLMPLMRCRASVVARVYGIVAQCSNSHRDVAAIPTLQLSLVGSHQPYSILFFPRNVHILPVRAIYILKNEESFIAVEIGLRIHLYLDNDYLFIYINDKRHFTQATFKCSADDQS